MTDFLKWAEELTQSSGTGWEWLIYLDIDGVEIERTTKEGSYSVLVPYNTPEMQAALTAAVDGLRKANQ